MAIITFSEKIKLLRKERNLTQEEASEQMKVALSSLRKYEQKGEPDVKQLIKIKEFYKVSYDYLLNDECNTRDVDNLEIVNNLGITEETVKSIKKIQKKDFLEDFFTNGKVEDLIYWLEEYNKTRFVNYYLKNKFCKKNNKEKTDIQVCDVKIYHVQFLIDYFKRKKNSCDYWEFVMEKELLDKILSGLNYIMDCCIDKNNIYAEDLEMKYFDNGLLKTISEKLVEYENYSYGNLIKLFDNFFNSYKALKIK